MSLLRFTFFLSLACTTTTHAQTVDYTKEIAPFWDSYCVDCHSADDADGEFALDTFAAMMNGNGKNEFMPPGKRDRVA